MGVQGSGSILPSGALAPTETLAVGEYTITIDGLDDSGEIRCIYPGDFVKHHGAVSVEELLTKVTNQLRGRYGDFAFTFVSIPATIEAGATIVINKGE